MSTPGAQGGNGAQGDEGTVSGELRETADPRAAHAGAHEMTETH